MLKTSRLNIEYAIMQETWPSFEFWRQGDEFGFQGRVRVNGKIYEMVITGLASRYPFEEPKVYLDPHPEGHHWIRDGGAPYLCYQRNNAWQPSRSTFASCAAVAIKYLKEFG